ncbi:MULTISPECIES: hypothetical protein [Providencia]|uniref:hypothetical protein n=1 Tax=Providencia TaxID=586 RepID=UPI002480DCFB|nr:hypothetical protein [Providencia rettgeri]
MFYLLIITQVLVYCLTLYFFVKKEKTGKHKKTFNFLLACLAVLTVTLLFITESGSNSNYSQNPNFI